MKTLLRLAHKELLVFAADRSGALLTVLIPVILAALTGMFFAPSGDKGVTVLVHHQGGPRAVALVAELAKTEGLKIEETSETDARDRVTRGKAPIALLLPADVETALAPTAFLGDGQAQIVMLRDPARAIESQFTQGILFRVLMEHLARGMTDPKELGALLKAQRTRLAASPLTAALWTPFLDTAEGLVAQLDTGAMAGASDGAGHLKLPVTLVVEESGPGKTLPEYHSYAHTFAGMLSMFLLFMAQGQAKRLVEERQEGTLIRLRMTPAPAWQLLAGVGLSTALIALMISAAVYAIGMLVFGIPVRGPVLGFVVVVLGLAAAVGGFALLLAGVGRTARQIENLGTFTILVMSFAGGAWLPSFLMPPWLSSLGLVLPTRWATDGLAAMTWRGLSFVDGLVPALVLVGFGVVTGLIGVRRFRWS